YSGPVSWVTVTYTGLRRLINRAAFREIPSYVTRRTYAAGEHRSDVTPCSPSGITVGAGFTPARTPPETTKRPARGRFARAAFGTVRGSRLPGRGSCHCRKPPVSASWKSPPVKY